MFHGCVRACSIERANFQDEIRKLTDLHEQKLQQYIDDSETKHQMEMDEIDERKTNHIMKLIQEHEASLTELRDYYNDITQNNLQLIASLKGQLEELRKKLTNSEQKLSQVCNSPSDWLLENIVFLIRRSQLKIVS